MKYPLSLRIVKDLLAERRVESCHETVQFWWIRYVPMVAAEDTLQARPHMPS